MRTSSATSIDKRFATVVLALLMALALVAGCTQATPTTTASETEPVASGGEEASTGSVEIVWYSTAPQDVLDKIAAKFNETHDNIKLSSQFQRGPELAQKVEAEAAAGKSVACIIMHPIPSILHDFRDRGLLMEYHSPEEAAYPEWFVEPGWWIGARVLDVPLVYNTNLVKEEPQSWEVLADPKYKGLLAFTDAGTIGGPPILTYKLLKDKYGDDFWPKVAANEPYIREQTGQVLEQLLNGEIAIGWIYGYNALTALRENPDAPIAMNWVDPTPLAGSYNALLSGCPNPEEAKVVYDWMASKEGQQVIVDTNRTLSARSDVDLGPGRVPFTELKWTAVDLDELAAEEPALKEEWNKVFGRE